MSSSKTANLQLNQWQAGDAFLRTEFNEDNAKVDAGMVALDTKMGAYADTLRGEQIFVKIADITTTAPSAQLDLDVSTLEWNKYVEVIIYAKIMCTGSSSVGSGCLRMNGYSGATDYEIRYSTSGNSSSYSNACVLQPMGGAASNRFSIFCLNEGYTIVAHNRYDASCDRNSGYCNRVPKLAEIRTFNFAPLTAGVTLLPGSQIMIYGVKK